MATQVLFEVYDPQKIDLLKHLLVNDLADHCVLVILRTRDAVHALASELANEGVMVDSIHGKKKPDLIARALEEFRAGKLRVLVSTDASARNLDLAGVQTILHVDLPELWQDYQDRWGLIQQADGQLLSFEQSQGSPALKSIEDVLGAPIPRLIADGFAYDKKPPRQNPVRNKTPKRGERSKPLQHKKKKWKPKKYGRN